MHILAPEKTLSEKSETPTLELHETFEISQIGSLVVEISHVPKVESDFASKNLISFSILILNNYET